MPEYVCQAASSIAGARYRSATAKPVKAPTSYDDNCFCRDLSLGRNATRAVTICCNLGCFSQQSKKEKR